jgi:hypothetical protein
MKLIVLAFWFYPINMSEHPEITMVESGSNGVADRSNFIADVAMVLIACAQLR